MPGFDRPLNQLWMMYMLGQFLDFIEGTGHNCLKLECSNLCNQWPNLKNLSGGLNLSRGLNMVGST